MKRLSAFTLIELLIVVAIIAILAAIAVPNFLEAQTRAKVSRAKADHRTIGIAIEAYAADQNHYPPWAGGKMVFDPADNVVEYVGGDMGFLPPVFTLLTTPVAYMGNQEASFRDPFGWYNSNAARTNGVYSILDQFYELALGNRGEANSFNPDSWELQSLGPDRQDNTDQWTWGPDERITVNGTMGNVLIYDPSNGTVSLGDIYRVGGRRPAWFQYPVPTN